MLTLPWVDISSFGDCVDEGSGDDVGRLPIGDVVSMGDRLLEGRRQIGRAMPHQNCLLMLSDFAVAASDAVGVRQNQPFDPAAVGGPDTLNARLLSTQCDDTTFIGLQDLEGAVFPILN